MIYGGNTLELNQFLASFDTTYKNPLDTSSMSNVHSLRSMMHVATDMNYNPETTEREKMESQILYLESTLQQRDVSSTATLLQPVQEIHTSAKLPEMVPPVPFQAYIREDDDENLAYWEPTVDECGKPAWPANYLAVYGARGGQGVSFDGKVYGTTKKLGVTGKTYDQRALLKFTRKRPIQQSPIPRLLVDLYCSPTKKKQVVGRTRSCLEFELTI